MITKGGLFHQPKSNFSYGYNTNTLHLRFRALKGEVKKAQCKIGDPFIWKKGGAGGGNLDAAGGTGWESFVYDMTLEVTTEYHDYFFVEISGLSKRSRYAFIVEDEDEAILFGERRMISLENTTTDPRLSDLSNFYCFPYLNESDVLKVPEWVKDTVWYQIFPDRFANGDKNNDPENTYPWGSKPDNDGYMGGDIQGIMDHLDYLEDLGINGIHFCPLFEGDTNHKYQTTDYKKIDTAFGSNDLFRSFVKEAHRRGIKVMLDGVFNHIGVNHPFFQDVVEKGEASIYSDWFNIHSFPVEPGNYETFATVWEMPRVNLECKAASDYFIEVGKYWIEEFGIDGWRLDVANEVTHDFWKVFRKELKALDEDLYIVGEVWHDGTPWVRGDQYDAVMHYPLMEACNHYFASGISSNEDFMATTNRLLVHYQKNAIETSYNLLDSHDTSRFLYESGNDVRKLILAYAYIFTHPGCPSIYYGDEIGMTGEKGYGKENHRKCMEWDSSKWNMNLLETMKGLIRIRATYKDLKKVEVIWHDVVDEGTLVFQRGAVTVVMNRNDYPTTVNLPEHKNSYELVRSHYGLDEHSIRMQAMDFAIIVDKEAYINPEQFKMAI